jgi:hypothetical protein
MKGQRSPGLLRKRGRSRCKAFRRTRRSGRRNRRFPGKNLVFQLSGSIFGNGAGVGLPDETQCLISLRRLSHRSRNPV